MNEMRKLMEAVEEAYQGGKTEHSGAKKGKGAYYGRKQEAKRDSNKNRRRADKAATKDVNEDGSLSTRTFAFYHVDDYGRPENDLPYVIVTVEDTGDEKADEQVARQLGVKKGIPDLKTGFLQAQDYSDDLLNVYDKARAKANKAQKTLRAIKNAKLNQVKRFRENRD